MGSTLNTSGHFIYISAWNLWDWGWMWLFWKMIRTVSPNFLLFFQKGIMIVDELKNENLKYSFFLIYSKSKRKWQNISRIILSWLDFVCLFVWFDSLRPINNLSVIKGRVFLGWTSTKLGLMFLLKDTTQWRRWGSNPRPFGLESSTLPLSHCAPSWLDKNR